MLKLLTEPTQIFLVKTIFMYVDSFFSVGKQKQKNMEWKLIYKWKLSVCGNKYNMYFCPCTLYVVYSGKFLSWKWYPLIVRKQVNSRHYLFCFFCSLENHFRGLQDDINKILLNNEFSENLKQLRDFKMFVVISVAGLYL